MNHHSNPCFSGAAAAPRLAVALELLGYLTATAAAAFCFLMGWLPSDGAAVLTLLLLFSLIGLAWKRFDGGRHPCFFFLCILTLFQAGRLIAFCTGGVTDIFRVTLMTSYQFDVSRPVAGTLLLSIALSAICIYAPCRWSYRALPPPRNGAYNGYLPYLYVLFYLSIPVQLYKNYHYYEYAREHGGYLVLFLDHGGLAASIPLAVRAVSLISLPALVGIFVLDPRKKMLRTTAAAYFMITSPVLLTGSRGGIFSLILSLWYLAKVKSGKRARLYVLGMVGAGLLAGCALIGSFRFENGETRPFTGLSRFIADQGASLDVTEVTIAYRQHFSPYLFSYLAGELGSAFVASDQSNYVAGKRFADDVAMFLSPTSYRLGFGSGSAYLAEAYMAGGLWGVILVSGLLGAGLHKMHECAAHPFGLFIVSMILPDVLWMARGGLLDWASVLLRVGISVLLLWMGWCLYRAIARIGCMLWASNCTLDQRAPVATHDFIDRRHHPPRDRTGAVAAQSRRPKLPRF
jgi:O-antigen polysaccharide polymerase Wzy